MTALMKPLHEQMEGFESNLLQLQKKKKKKTAMKMTKQVSAEIRELHKADDIMADNIPHLD